MMESSAQSIDSERSHIIMMIVRHITIIMMMMMIVRLWSEHDKTGTTISELTGSFKSPLAPQAGPQQSTPTPSRRLRLDAVLPLPELEGRSML